MQTFSVKLNTAGSRVIRAHYGSADVFGAALSKDPVAAEAVRGWEALGSPDGGATIEVVVATAAELKPAVPEPVALAFDFDFAAHKTKGDLAQAFASAFGVDLDQSKKRAAMEADARAYLEGAAA